MRASILDGNAEKGGSWKRAVLRGRTLAQRSLDALIGCDYNGPDAQYSLEAAGSHDLPIRPVQQVDSKSCGTY